jgi:hypothetical protein
MSRMTTGAGRRSRKNQTSQENEPRLLQVETGETVATPGPSEQSQPAAFRWLWYLLSLGVPFAGVVIGIFLYDHDSRSIRLMGRNSLLIGFVVWVLMPLALILLLAILFGVAAWDLIANAVPSGS